VPVSARFISVFTSAGFALEPPRLHSLANSILIHDHFTGLFIPWVPAQIIPSMICYCIDARHNGRPERDTPRSATRNFSTPQYENQHQEWS
jgi:hypothetical protein